MSDLAWLANQSKLHVGDLCQRAVEDSLDPGVVDLVEELPAYLGLLGWGTETARNWQQDHRPTAGRRWGGAARRLRPGQQPTSDRQDQQRRPGTLLDGPQWGRERG